MLSAGVNYGYKTNKNPIRGGVGNPKAPFSRKTFAIKTVANFMSIESIRKLIRRVKC